MSAPLCVSKTMSMGTALANPPARHQPWLSDVCETDLAGLARNVFGRLSCKNPCCARVDVESVANKT